MLSEIGIFAVFGRFEVDGAGGVLPHAFVDGNGAGANLTFLGVVDTLVVAVDVVVDGCCSDGEVDSVVSDPTAVFDSCFS